MRLVDWKRPELITDAARGLPGAVVVILGEGPEEERLRSLADGVDLRLPGFRPDAVSLLPALDVFIHPCPTDNQPLAVFEALASGVPVIVADEGGASLMVDDWTDRPPRAATAEGMAAAVVASSTTPSSAERLAAAGREEVLERFTTQAMTRQVEELYERLSMPRRRRRPRRRGCGSAPVVARSSSVGKAGDQWRSPVADAARLNSMAMSRRATDRSSSVTIFVDRLG